MKKAALLFGLSLAAPVYAADPYANAGYGPGVAAPADSAIYEVLARVEQLQSEVQQLRGLVEEQAQTIKDLERKQTNMYSDLDGRVQALSAPVPTASTAASATATNTPVPAADRATVEPAVVANTPVPAASAPQVANTAAPTPAKAESKSQSPVAPTPTAATANGNEKERYQVAYDTLRNGHNAQAVQLFESLIADYPAGEYADNAQYWLGEAYKINRDVDKARAAFTKVVSQYPTSSKVPDALLKLGYIEADQQNVAKARDYLTRVTTSYPNTTAAHLAAKRLTQFAQ